MKKKHLLLLGMLLFPFLLVAQKIEITPFGGYIFPARMNGSGGYVRFEGNAQYGGQLSIAVSRVMDVDLIYQRTDTRAEVDYALWPYEEVPLSINYMMLGFTKNFRVSKVFCPYAGLNLGACLMAPKQDYNDVWFFALGIKAGAKIYAGKRIGFRIQGDFLVPVQSSGFTFFVGTGGTGGGVSLYGSMLQIGVSGGLIFRLGHVSN